MNARAYVNPKSTSMAELTPYVRRLPAHAQTIGAVIKQDDRVPIGMVLVVIDGGLIAPPEPAGMVDE